MVLKNEIGSLEVENIGFKNYFFSFTLKVFIFVTFLVSGIIIHELGHALGFIITNSKLIRIGFNTENFTAYTRGKTYNPESRLFVIISGSFFSVLCFALLKLGLKHKKNATLHLSINTVILNEFLYWAYSTYIGFGDAYLFIKFMNLNALLIGSFILIMFFILYGFILLEFSKELKIGIVKNLNPV